MKYLELFWNRLYYCIFKCDKKTQTLLNRFFECLFYYLKFYRNRKGNNTRIPYNETVGICVSDYIMRDGFTCLLIWTLFNLVSIFFPCVSLLPLGKTVFILVSVVPCLFINFFFLWRKDKYLRYWEVFAKDTPGIRRVWYCITCVCLLLVWPIFIFSMIIMSNLKESNNGIFTSLRNPFFYNRYSLIVPHNKKAKINRSHFVCYLFDFCHHLCLLRNLLHYP